MLAAGCASLDKDECRAANWYAIGLEDGARGRAGHACAAGCPEPLGGRFLSAYQHGRELHELHRKRDARELELRIQ